jgi:DtxR family Mn-dependent transcriptional regulator
VANASKEGDSEHIEEYLETLYNLSDNDKPIRTGDISRKLNIAPASVTEMVQRLAKKGYLEYERYRGVTFTPKGLELARRIARRHRLIEKFLVDVLNLDKDMVHGQACRMEHAINDDVEDALCRILNAPELCPDDQMPIPSCERGIGCEDCNPKESKSVSDLKKNKGSTISHIASEESGDITRLMDLGFKPGIEVFVRSVSDDSVHVELGKKHLLISKMDADSIKVHS